MKKYEYGCEGFDTETDDGYARIIADGNSYTEVESLDDALAFLTRKEARNRHNFFYNLRYDVAAIFKQDPGVLRSLFCSGRAEYAGFRFAYIPKKLLCIRSEDKHIYRFTDIAQFYMCSLETAAQKYLGEKTHELKGRRDRLFSEIPTSRIGEYCQHDALLTRKLGEKHLESIHALGLFPRMCISGANLSEVYLRQNADLPHIYDVPRRIAEMYYKAYRGGWFEMFQRGRFRAWQYDITSAYPEVLRDLPDLRRGRWVRGIRFEAPLGVCRVLLRTCRTSCPPLSCYRPQMLSYPEIDVETVAHITLSEYRALKDVYKMELLDAWSFVPEGREAYPFRECVDRLFSLKQSLKGDAGRYNAVKITLNSIYGKTFQKTQMPDGEWKAGKLFNPVYAAEITARTRMKIWDSIHGCEENIIGVATDAVLSTKPLKLPIGKDMGQWQEEKAGSDLIVVMNGIYQFFGDQGKLRGSPMKKGLSLNYAADSDVLHISGRRPLSPKEAFARNDPGLANIFVDASYDISLENRRRIEIEAPETFRDLLYNVYDSKPLPLSLIYYQDNKEKEVQPVHSLG